MSDKLSVRFFENEIRSVNNVSELVYKIKLCTYLELERAG